VKNIWKLAVTGALLLGLNAWAEEEYEYEYVYEEVVEEEAPAAKPAPAKRAPAKRAPKVAKAGATTKKLAANIQFGGAGALGLTYRISPTMLIDGSLTFYNNETNTNYNLHAIGLLVEKTSDKLELQYGAGLAYGSATLKPSQEQIDAAVAVGQPAPGNTVTTTVTVMALGGGEYFLDPSFSFRGLVGLAYQLEPAQLVTISRISANWYLF
jgi:hypothetical protein